ncbi:MAG: hypothetical protein L6Q57_06065, partial [Alphaproteobacteria bacterium]|nr:hypothetical protein [Alphaproteobacteria bacterium]
MNTLRRYIIISKKTALLLLVFMLAFPAAMAGTQSQTVKGIQAIEKGRWTEGQKLLAGSQDPLAVKIYYWLLLSRDGLPENYGHLTQFIRSNPDWPGMDSLKLKAEQAMPADMSAAGVIAWFKDFPPQSAKGFDRYLTALRTSGQEDNARDLIEAWWKDAILSRTEQKEIYKRHGMLITRAAHERRLDTLLFSGQNENARAIAALLGPATLAVAEARIALAQDLGDIKARLAAVPALQQNDPGLLY